MFKKFITAVGCCLMLACESLAQYRQPAYNYQAPPNQNFPGGGMVHSGPSEPGSGAGYGHGAPMTRASTRLRQEQAEFQGHMDSPMQIRNPMSDAAMQGHTGAGYGAPNALVPSMAAPAYHGSQHGRESGCSGGGCDFDGYGNGPAGVGGNYFGQCDHSCGDACCTSNRYVRVFGGWNWLENMNLNFQTGANDGLASFNDGWGVGGAIGSYMTPNARRELEFTFRNNTGENLSLPGLMLPLDGRINCYSAMGNLVYEVPALQLAGFSPYFGGGLGVAHIDGESTGDVFSIDETVFAYQAFLGVDRQISGQAKLFAEYRYFGTSTLDVTGLVSASEKYQANNLFFGLQLSR